MKKRIGLDAIILIVLLIVLAVVSLQIAGRDTSGDEGTTPRRSSASASPGGWKAAFLLLQRAGYKTGRWEKPPKSWPDSASVVVAGQEVQAFSGDAYWKDDQASDALDWVGRGGTLLLLTAQGNALTEKLGIEPRPGKHDDADIHPTQPMPYLAGVKDVVAPGNERFLTLGNDATVLLGDDKPAVIAIKRGKGRIIAVATPAVIENKHLAEDDNARFLVQTVAAFSDPKRGGGVLFDEYHQGYQEETTFWTALGQPGQFAVLQLVALIALVCYSASFRFGLPRPLPPQDRLSSEYVSSLADLYRRARASDAALDGVYLSFWRDLCRAVGMPLDSDTEQVARRAAASLGNDLFGPNVSQIRAKREQKLLNLLRQCEIKIDAGARKLPENELLQLARGLEDMRKELQLGRDERRTDVEVSPVVDPGFGPPPDGDEEATQAQGPQSPNPEGFVTPANIAPAAPMNGGAVTGATAYTGSGAGSGAVHDPATFVAELAQKLSREIHKAIQGQEEVVEAALVCLLTGGHGLFEGVPGTAKTLLVRSISATCQAEFKRIQFTPDLMPSDIAGTNVFDINSGTFNLKRGPVFAEIVLADEINRTPPKTQAALLEAMEERRVSVDGISHHLPPIFTVFATQNPVEYEGTYPLPEAQLDRFLLKMVVPYPTEEAETAMLTAWDRGFKASDLHTAGLEPVASVQDLLTARSLLVRVTVESKIINYITQIIRATRSHRQLTLGASPRAAVALLQASKTLALMRRRAFVIPDDIKQMALPVLRHRILLKPEAEIEGVGTDRVLTSLLETVEVPR